MSLSTTILETQLRALAPSPLGEALVTRLETGIHDAETQFADLESPALAKVSRHSAAPLPDQLSASLMHLLQDVPFPADHNVLLFTKAAPTVTRRKSRSGWLAAVASVALLGAMLALFWSPVPTPPQPISQRSPLSTIQSDQFVPTAMGRRIQEARQDGLLGANSEHPHRVLRVVYVDQISMQNADGETVRVDKPRVEYILVPAPLD